MRIAAMGGGGSIGIVMAALATQKGYPIDIVDTFKENVDALNEHGATIIGCLEMNTPVKAMTPDEIQGIYDLVFLCNKQTSNEVVLQKVLQHIHKDSLVITLQNGIPEEAVAEVVGAHRTGGGAVAYGAAWISPGVTKLTAKMEAVEKFAFDIGEYSGKVTERIKYAQKVLGCVGGTIVLDNLIGARWAKLFVNATFSGMSAALGCTYGDVFDSPVAIAAAANVADEVIKVSKALGVEMPEIAGIYLSAFELRGKDDIPQMAIKYKQAFGAHAATRASMLQDLEKSRKTEIHYINGHVSMMGKKIGIATPFNDKIVTMVQEQETAGQVTKSIYNAKEFVALL